MRRLAWFVGLVLMAAEEPEVIRDWQGGPARSTVAVTAAEHFRLPKLEAWARKYLELNRPYFKIMKWYVGLDRGDLGIYLAGATEMTYATWRGLYDKYGEPLLPMAEMVAIGDAAVLKVRYWDCKVYRKVLRGVDPLEIRIPGFRGEVLHVAYSLIPESLRDESNERIWLHFYVRTDMELGKVPGVAVVGHLQRLAGMRNVSVSMRNDIWFIESDSFPLVYRFAEQLVPPTEAQYRQSNTLHCWPDRGDLITCALYP